MASHPEERDHDTTGVDRSLLRSILGLSPLERLRRMEQAARDIRKLNEYGRRHRETRARPHR